MKNLYWVDKIDIGWGAVHRFYFTRREDAERLAQENYTSDVHRKTVKALAKELAELERKTVNVYVEIYNSYEDYVNGNRFVGVI